MENELNFIKSFIVYMPRNVKNFKQIPGRNKGNSRKVNNKNKRKVI